MQPNTIYHYSIGTGLDHTFRTPPLPGRSGFTVEVEGDMGASDFYSNVPGVQHLIASQLPTFVLVVGDLTYGNQNGQATVDRHFNDVMVWSQDTAYMPAWGNHEWDVPEKDDLRNYKGRFDLPHAQVSPEAPKMGCCGKDWYWFDYGNTRFIAYPEPYGPRTWSEWKTKAKNLMDQAEDEPGIVFIITFGHRPAYCSGYYYPGESELKADLDTLGDTHPKYVLNLNGHSHNYERSHPQHGVVHITAGTGGSELEERNTPCLFGVCPAPPWCAFRAMRFGVVKLDFLSREILGSFLCGPAGGGKNDVQCIPGSVVDRFSIGTHQRL